MKKTLLTFAFAAMGIAAFAQKPSAGNITTEIGLSSLLGTPANPATANIPVGMFRLRYFLSGDMAVRAHLGFGMGSTVANYSTAPGVTPPITGEATTSTTGFGLAVGIEKHLAGTDKLSPYLGAEIGFGMGSMSIEATNSTNGTTITGSGDALKVSGGGTTTIALNGLIGADYYITEKVYIGAEMGIGLFNMASSSDRETATTTGGVSTTTTTPGGSSNGFGLTPGVIGMVRVGIILF